MSAEALISNNVAPIYGSKAQQMAVIDDSPHLDPAQKKTIQEIIGAFHPVLHTGD